MIFLPFCFIIKEQAGAAQAKYTAENLDLKKNDNTNTLSWCSYSILSYKKWF
jgi:hypothetical protein